MCMDASVNATFVDAAARVVCVGVVPSQLKEKQDDEDHDSNDDENLGQERLVDLLGCRVRACGR